MLHRFAVAGTGVRMQAVNSSIVEDILTLDSALKCNDRDLVEELPEEIEKNLVAKLYYGHFLCLVFHQDYNLRKGTDPKAIKQKMLAYLDKRGAEYPAEHNAGHLYKAKAALVEHYQTLDPTNAFNSGIGKTPRDKNYGITCGCDPVKAVAG